jgi:hypothetical protein
MPNFFRLRSRRRLIAGRIDIIERNVVGHRVGVLSVTRIAHNIREPNCSALAARSCRQWPPFPDSGCGFDALADVGFEDAEGAFMPLQCDAERVQKPLRREVVENDALRDVDGRFRRCCTDAD